MAKLEITMLAGHETKAFLASLESVVTRLEKLGLNKDAPEVDEEDDEETDVISTSKLKAKKAATPVDEDEDEEGEEADEDEEEDEDEDEESDEDDEDEDEEPEEVNFKAKKKAKKVTVDDVNDACKLRASSIGGKKGREEVLKILKKKFKTESVSELKPEQYQACIDAMAVAQ